MMKKLRYGMVFIALNMSVNILFAQSVDPVAENMVLYQRSVGGWPKHIGEQRIDYTKQLSDAEKAGILDDKGRNDATIDNSATSKEIRYLVSAYKKTKNSEYLDAAEKGIRYLLVMQHANGGWPQFYPDSSLYRNEITFNDNAMINAMNVLWDVVNKTNGFDIVDPSLVKPSETAINKGIDCILRTQIKQNGKLTAWCAQYNDKTLLPTKARAYELVSISGSESAGIVDFLMKIRQPSAAVRNAVNSAIAWLQSVAIKGFRYADIKDPSQPNGRDRVVLPDPNSVIWARFYDIDTNKPFFCGRNGIKKWSVAEIEPERRTGYAWYGVWPKDLLEKKYPEWKNKSFE